MRALSTSANTDVGFQIAPMIDVVFVILIFFMAMAAQIRLERILLTKLPGVAATEGATAFVDEQVIQIGESGEVSLNEEGYDAVGSTGLPVLTATLLRLKASSDAAHSKVVVTLLSHPESPYARTIDVLNALAVAGIANVTFTAGTDLQ